MLSAILIAGSVLFLMVLSVKYDYGESLFALAQSPYFNSGRLIYGTLVPMLALYVCGVEALTRRA